MMNLQEYEYVVVCNVLRQDAIKCKWEHLCWELGQLDVSTISELINNGFLEPLIDLEAQDCFGTEGMKL